MTATLISFTFFMMNAEVIPAAMLAPSLLCIISILFAFKVCPIKLEVVVLPFVPLIKQYHQLVKLTFVKYFDLLCEQFDLVNQFLFSCCDTYLAC